MKVEFPEDLSGRAHQIVLKKGDWVEDPTHPGERIVGPAKLEFRGNPNGIELRIL